MTSGSLIDHGWVVERSHVSSGSWAENKSAMYSPNCKFPTLSPVSGFPVDQTVWPGWGVNLWPTVWETDTVLICGTCKLYVPEFDLLTYCITLILCHVTGGMHPSLTRTASDWLSSGTTAPEVASRCLTPRLSRLRWEVTASQYSYMSTNVGWLCLTSHRQRGHLETAPPFTVPCEGREAR